MSRQLAKVGEVKNFLQSDAVKQRFDEILHERAGVFVAALTVLVSNDTYLAECTPQSILSSAIQAAALNLSINKSLGHAYIVPMKNKDVSEAQMVIGWRGLVQLAQRSGLYKSINSANVRAGDIRSYNRVTGEITWSAHVTMAEKEDAPVVGYYAGFRLTNGFGKDLYWPKETVTNHARRYSKSFKSGYGAWASNFDEMAQKTLLRQVLKYGPLSIDMERAMAADEEQSAMLDNGEFEIITPESATPELTPELKSGADKVLYGEA